MGAGKSHRHEMVFLWFAAAAFLVAVFAFGPVVSKSAARGSNHSKCEGQLPFKHLPDFSRKVRRIDDKWTNSHRPMPANDVKRLLRAAWSGMYQQCHGKKLSAQRLSFRVHANAYQANKDSGFIPAARSPTGQHAKGMLQVIDEVFRHWHLPHHKNVYSPLDDVLAVVNIQLNARSVISVVDGHHYAHNVIDGRHHGWGFHGGDNHIGRFADSRPNETDVVPDCAPAARNRRGVNCLGRWSDQNGSSAADAALGTYPRSHASCLESAGNYRGDGRSRKLPCGP